jgi:hypothetical protein
MGDGLVAWPSWCQYPRNMRRKGKKRFALKENNGTLFGGTGEGE